MQDTTDNGQATPDANVWFYTNLRPPTEVEKQNEQFSTSYGLHAKWCLLWLQSKNIDKHFSAFNDLDRAWKSYQLSHILENENDYDELNDQHLYPEIKERYGGYQPIFKNCMLEALATAAIKSDAYLFTTKGAKWDEKSIWATVEYGPLTMNKNIQRIWRADPSPGACDEGELLWERGRDPEYSSPYQFICPVENSNI